MSYSMPEDVKAEITALTEHALCGARCEGYKAEVLCTREAGHQGRHWSDYVNWP